MANTIYLVDGSALFYRSYFAFIRNPLINSKGEDTSVTFGFLSSLIHLIEEQNPTHLAIIFDTKEPTFRHKIYPAYKATREKMPEEMAAQYPRLIDSLKRLNFMLIDKEGFEADDIIGTLATSYASSENQIYIVSGDKDMAQLVNENIFLFNPGKSNQPPEILDAEGVREKMGVKPEQIIDWLVMIGDSSDNIPGIPKIGKITAIKLLGKYGSLSSVYEHLNEIDQKVIKENLITYREQTKTAEKLAAIRLDVPVEQKLDDLCFRLWDIDEAERVMQELEFRRLSDRMRKIARSENKLEELKKQEDQTVSYQLIDTMESLDQLVTQLKRQKQFVFDLETSSLDFLTAQIAGIALAWEENKAYYIPVSHPNIALDKEAVLNKLRPVFADPAIKKIAQNIKFDAMILREHGVEVRGMYFDTMIAAYLINPGSQLKLDKLSEYYLNYEMIPIESLIGTGKNQKSMTEVPAEEAARYAAEDADIELKLYQIFKKKLTELGLDNLFYNLEMALVPAIMQVEKNGVKIDTGLLQQLSEKLEVKNSKLEEKIYKEAGESFNLNSPQQLGNILFDKLQIHNEIGVKKPKRTKTGQYSTSESTLERYAAHPVIQDILDYRKLTKLKNTYIDILPGLISPVTGKVHTSFNQTVTTTGRLSSSDPNLQNIPIRTEIGREIRKAFIPSQKDWLILSADYSQIELRIMAHLSRDENMQRSFRQKQDIHASTAAQIFNIPIEMVSGDQRRKAKEINFGIIYGMSQYGLAARLNIGVEDAETFIAEYKATYPGIDLFMKAAIKMARDKGYVETIMKRRRYLPEIRSDNFQIRQFAERTAINTPIQGSAADLIKKAMIEIHDFIYKHQLPVRMLLQVHDELVFEAEKSTINNFAGEVKKIMENTWKFDLPIIAETGIGENWLEAHE
ncbi:MAG: DNA polymerase I [Calditrichaceae bacterium]|nr:DNA polymerase I [Calditrichaceae bacterium]